MARSVRFWELVPQGAALDLYASHWVFCPEVSFFFQVCLQLSGGPSSSPLGPHPYRNVQSGHAKWLTITTRHALVIGVGHREANMVQFEFQAPLSASPAHGPVVRIRVTPAFVLLSGPSALPGCACDYMDLLLPHCPLVPAEYLEPLFLAAHLAGRLRYLRWITAT